MAVLSEDPFPGVLKTAHVCHSDRHLYICINYKMGIIITHNTTVQSCEE